MQFFSWLPFVLLIIIGAGIMALGALRKGEASTFEVLKRESCGTKNCLDRFFPNEIKSLSSKARKMNDALFWGGVSVMIVGLLYGRILTARVNKPQGETFGTTVMGSLFGAGGAQSWQQGGLLQGALGGGGGQYQQQYAQQQWQ